ncbi:hypothetical protein M8818_006048 [Zalaria obscura]|uniref:Uncharacterized protein n=1 Tax=Zalaria obscura TaxID=2024903 RepID=A0ACC3S6T0_9PEZI
MIIRRSTQDSPRGLQAPSIKLLICSGMVDWCFDLHCLYLAADVLAGGSEVGLATGARAPFLLAGTRLQSFPQGGYQQNSRQTEVKIKCPDKPNPEVDRSRAQTHPSRLYLTYTCIVSRLWSKMHLPISYRIKRRSAEAQSDERNDDWLYTYPASQTFSVSFQDDAGHPTIRVG